MMAKQLLSVLGKLMLPLLVLSMVLCPVAAHAGDLKLEFTLIWGTNQDTSPDASHKPVSAPVTEKLGKTYKWKHYFEVNRQTATVQEKAAAQKLRMSPQCTVEVSNMGTNRIEVKLFGSGKLVTKGAHTIKNEPLLIGGPAPGDNSWFIMVNEKK